MMKSKSLKNPYTFVNNTTDEIKDERKKQHTSIKSLVEIIARIEACNAIYKGSSWT